MKIGIVIHGPEVIDSGQAETVLKRLSEIWEVKAELGGTMGKAAVLDAGLEDVIDISRHLKPSACIESFFETTDLVCLLNQGKTLETGKAFGVIVASKLRDPEKKALILIERPCCFDGKLVPLNKKAIEYIEEFFRILGIPAESAVPSHIDSIRIEHCQKTGKKRIIRKISGAFPGENILVNGITIGKAESSELKIISEDGFITAIEGGIIKEHGLEKLHNYEKRDPVDLTVAWVKSGVVRRSIPAHRRSPKSISRSKKAEKFPAVENSPEEKKSLENRFPEDQSSPKDESSHESQSFPEYENSPKDESLKCGPFTGGGKVVLIDHAAEHSFELAEGSKLAITVGDDTTAIAGDLLYRLGIPILGITDGDCDGLTSGAEAFPGSVILRLSSGKDDLLGKKLKQELFKGAEAAVFEDLLSLKKEVLKLAGLNLKFVFEY